MSKPTPPTARDRVSDEMRVQFDRAELEAFFAGFASLPNPLEDWLAESAEREA
jgi:hypothetical protein